MKRNAILTFCAAAALSLALTGCGQQNAQANYIGIDAAKAIALDAAGISETGASFSTAELDSRNGTDYYDVEFTANGQEYEYDIDAITGVVINSNNQTTPSTGTEQSTSTPPATTAPTSVTEAKAKEIALDHAKLKADQVVFLQSSLDWDDGRQVYEVEFYSKDNKEYDYTIDAATGEILSYDYDTENTHSPATSSNPQTISAERAKEIALAKVPGSKLTDIYEFEVDRDDGRLEYEGTIHYNGVEYDFSIDGYSGAIRSWETERHH